MLQYRSSTGGQLAWIAEVAYAYLSRRCVGQLLSATVIGSMPDSKRSLPNEIDPAWQRQFSLRGLLIYITVFAVLLSVARIAIVVPLSALVWLMAVGGWLGFGLAFLFGQRYRASNWALTGGCLPALLLFLGGLFMILATRGAYTKKPVAPPQRVNQAAKPAEGVQKDASATPRGADEPQGGVAPGRSDRRNLGTDAVQ